MPTLWRRVKTDGSYLSASDFRVHFGLDDSRRVPVVRVVWPDGHQERWTDVETQTDRDAAARGRGHALQKGSRAAIGTPQYLAARTGCIHASGVLHSRAPTCYSPP